MIIKIMSFVGKISNNCLTTIIVLFAIIIFSQAFSFKIAHNSTESLPQKFFLILEGKMPLRYDYIAFSKKNKFYKKGFIKKVVGKAGDRITIDKQNNISILSDQKAFSAGYIKKYSLSGEKLHPITYKKIPKNNYYIFAPHKDSLDSRYSEIGLIKKNQIIGKAIPLENIHLICVVILLIIAFYLIRKMLMCDSRSLILKKFLIGLLFLSANSKELLADDLGIHGKIYQIQELDLSQAIKNKLLALEDSGELLQIQKDQQNQVKKRAERPKAVIGLKKASIDREFTYDPTVTVNKNIYDHQGNVVVEKGKRVNPLSYRSLPQRLLFIDGDDEDQVNWAFLKAEINPSIIILTKGNIMQMMRKHKVRLYFDQNGFITKTFGIHALPAQVRQEGDILKVKEEAL